MNNSESEYSLLFEIRNKCNYEYVQGKELVPENGERSDEKDLVLENRLSRSLGKLNTWMDQGDIENSVKKLKSLISSKDSLPIAANEKLVDIITGGIFKIEKKNEKGKIVSGKVRFFDLENPLNNEFLITKGFELVCEGEVYEFDIVAFINGIPAVLCERRRMSKKYCIDESLIKKEVFSKLQSLIRVKSVANANMVNLIYTDERAYMGSITDLIHEYRGFGAGSFEDWRTELFNKENIIGLLKSGIWFENSTDDGRRVKRITSLGSMEGVIELLGRLKSGRSGVFQMFCGVDSSRAIRVFSSLLLSSERLKGYKIVFLTKREKVKKSIERIMGESPFRIRNFKNIKDFASEGSDPEGMGIIFAKEEMLESIMEIYSDFDYEENAGNLIFVVDGFENETYKIQKLKRIFEKDMFFEFEWSSPNVDSMPKRLVKGPKMAIDEGSIVKTIVKNKKAGFDTESSIEGNIEKKAADVLIDYFENSYAQGFKAAIFCDNENIAKLYDEMIKKHIGEMKKEKIKTCMYLKGAPQEELAKVQKAMSEPLNKDVTAVVICDEVPDSSFEMKQVKAVYSDCVIESEVKIQRALCAGCTKLPGKNFAQFTDYRGIKGGSFIEDEYISSDYFMREFAIAYERFGEELFKMEKKIEDIIENEKSIDNIVKKMNSPDKRAQFEMLYRRYSVAAEELMADMMRSVRIEKFERFSRVQAALKAAYEPEKGFEAEHMGRRGRRFLYEYFSGIGEEKVLIPISIFDEDFSEKINSMPGITARAYSIENAIRRAIEINLDKNPGFYEKLLRKLETILIDTQNDFEEREKALKNLIEEEVEEELVKAKKLGISIEEYKILKIIEKFAIDGVAGIVLMEISKNIKSVIMETVEKIFSRGWSKDDEKVSIVEYEVKKRLISEHAQFFKMEGIKKVSKELSQFAAGRYETMEVGKKVKEVSVDDFMREILG